MPQGMFLKPKVRPNKTKGILRETKESLEQGNGGWECSQLARTPQNKERRFTHECLCPLISDDIFSYENYTLRSVTRKHNSNTSAQFNGLNLNIKGLSVGVLTVVVWFWSSSQEAGIGYTLT